MKEGNSPEFFATIERSDIGRLEAVAYLGFRGGGSKFFWKSGGICMARSGVAKGVRGHAPPRNFFKMGQFGAF